MKQLILNALKAKFQGVSDAILDRVATKLAQTVTTQEQVQTAVDGVTFQQVLESYGDSRATQATQTAVHNYEQKYGLKDGIKVDAQQQQQVIPPTGSQVVQPPVTVPPTAGGALDAHTLALLNQIANNQKTITERLDRMDTDRTTSTRRQQISQIIEKLPENLRKPYERTPVEGLTEEEFNTLVAEITSEVNTTASTLNQRGAVFGKPAAQGGTQTQGTELTEEQIKAITHRDGVAGADGQPF